jgi:hypothetical protein
MPMTGYDIPNFSYYLNSVSFSEKVLKNTSTKDHNNQHTPKLVLLLLFINEIKHLQAIEFLEQSRINGSVNLRQDYS